MLFRSPKKQHFCHHCGVARHTQPNCYMWLATQKGNSMIVSRDQNQLPSSFALLEDFLKALMFLSKLNGFNSSPSLLDQEELSTKFDEANQTIGALRFENNLLKGPRSLKWSCFKSELN